MSRQFLQLLFGSSGCCGRTSPGDDIYKEFQNFDDIDSDFELQFKDVRKREDVWTEEEVKEDKEVETNIDKPEGQNGMGDPGHIDPCKSSTENISRADISVDDVSMDEMSIAIDEHFYWNFTRNPRQSWSMSNVLNLSDSRDLDGSEAELSSTDKRGTYPPRRRINTNFTSFQNDKGRDNFTKLWDHRSPANHSDKGCDASPRYHRIPHVIDRINSDTSNASTAESGSS